MKMTVAKTAGFCFGVSRGVKGTFALLETEPGRRLATLGELIHNPQIVATLQEKGVRLLEAPTEAAEGETVIIRSHGVEREIYSALEASGNAYVDFTCPYVQKIHRLVEEADRGGRHIFIIGHGVHPEVRGIQSYGTKVHIFSEAEEIENFTKSLENTEEIPISVVVQTTFDVKKWKICRNFIKKHYTNVKIFDTICKATEKRQQEAETLAKSVDACFVVGGRASSNTNRLYEVCKEHCPRTFLIEDGAEIGAEMLQNCSHIGITAGASTPKEVIDGAVQAIEALGTQQ